MVVNSGTVATVKQMFRTLARISSDREQEEENEEETTNTQFNDE